MPRSELTLVIGTSAWANWASYEVTAQFETPSDGWRVEASSPTAAQVASLPPGAVVMLLLGQTTVLRGRMDRVELRRTRSAGTTIALSGRDLAGQLVDCCPPASWSWTNLSLSALANKALQELGIPATVDASAEASTPIKRVKAEPGETYWQVLDRYARQARLMLWMTPAGVLRIGRPNYTSTPVARLVLGATAGTANFTTVEESVYVNDFTQRFSTVTVLGQCAGTDGLFGTSAAHLKGQASDADLVAAGLARSLLLDVGGLRSSSAAKARAEWEVSSRRYHGLSLEYVVAGHGPSASVPWQLDTMVDVVDELAGVSDPWWLSGYRMLRDSQSGSRTALTLRPANSLLPEVGP